MNKRIHQLPDGLDWLKYNLALATVCVDVSCHRCDTTYSSVQETRTRCAATWTGPNCDIRKNSTMGFLVIYYAITKNSLCRLLIASRKVFHSRKIISPQNHLNIHLH